MKNPDPVIVVCGDITEPLLIPDNRTGRCDRCFRLIQFRPHVPRGHRLCLECALPAIAAGGEVTITPRMLEDALAYLQKQKQ